MRVAALLAPLPGGAEAACRLALALALDVSSSVDAAEDALQREGLANALLAPEVQAAILSIPDLPVAVMAFEWSGRRQQSVLLDWRLLDGPGDVASAAEAIRSSRRVRDDYPTAIGNALGYASGVFADSPDCLFRTLDVSGDGRNNDGFPPVLAYRHFPLDGIVVNALAIGGEDAELAAYYRDELIRGPGSFVEEARDYADFERAIRRKLLREIKAIAVGRDGSRSNAAENLASSASLSPFRLASSVEPMRGER